MTFPDPPRGRTALLWRAPIWIYRLGLGWTLGSRFLLLTHTGRKSGLPRQTVLEIIHTSPDKRDYTVVSGYGSKSQWYKNISNNSNVQIRIGRNQMSAQAQRLDPDLAEDVFIEYIRRFPRGFRSLAKLVGYQIKHTEEGYRQFGRRIPIIPFSTTQPTTSFKQ